MAPYLFLALVKQAWIGGAHYPFNKVLQRSFGFAWHVCVPWVDKMKKIFNKKKLAHTVFHIQVFFNVLWKNILKVFIVQFLCVKGYNNLDSNAWSSQCVSKLRCFCAMMYQDFRSHCEKCPSSREVFIICARQCREEKKKGWYGVRKWMTSNKGLKQDGIFMNVTKKGNANRRNSVYLRFLFMV